MERLLQDCRYALRSLRKSPAFTFAAAASLALGIGVNTLMFSLIHSVLLRPLPVERPEELVEVYSNDGGQIKFATNSYLDFQDLRAKNSVFSDLAAKSLMFAALNRDHGSELLFGEVVSANYFDLLGVRPVLGRSFLPEEDGAEGARPVAILSHRFWQKNYGGAAAALGQTVKLRGLPFTIVGVAPARFQGTLPGIAPDLWIPTAMVAEVEPVGMQDVVPSPTGATRRERRGTRWLFLTGRLKPGVTVAAAQANLDQLMAGLAKDYPETNAKRVARVVPSSEVRLHPLIDGALGSGGMVLLGVVALVLLVACANVANMLLARATARRREMGVRLAIGAGRGRLVRQLLTESLLIALLGGALGLLLAFWGKELLGSWQPPVPIRLALELSLSGPVFLYALGASVVAAVLFGLAPAWTATRQDLVTSLKGEAAVGAVGRRIQLRDALVVGQVAATLVLLVLSGLLLKSMARTLTADLGFKPEGLALTTIDVAMVRYSKERGEAFYQAMLERAKALPGVEHAAYASRLPLAININVDEIFIDGREPDADGRGLVVDSTMVSPDYFATIGVPLLRGREFTTADTPDSPKVAVINETMAEKYWPNEDALGKRFRMELGSGTVYEVVGVAADHKVRTAGEPPRPFLHLARDQSYSAHRTLLVRTRGDAREVVQALRRELLAAEPELVLLEDQTMSEMIAHTTVPARLGAAFFAAFGLLALVLAAVGLYGVMAYSVSRRTREIGIRQAVGARPKDLLAMVLGKSMKLVGVGLTAGLAVAVLATILLSKAFYGLGAFELPTYLLAGTVLAAVGLAASLIPARRAARLDPLLALKTD